MVHKVKGVVAKSKGDPVAIEMIEVPNPGPGEVLIDVKACGVCHTDLHYREGAINDEFPFLLGHEAAGIVEEVGEGVSDLNPGDFVILNWRAVCGHCRSCRRGRPWNCFATHNATQKMTLDSKELSPALGIGAFAEKTLVAAGQATKVNPAAKPEVAGLIGCGVMAGLGAAMNTGQVSRGDSVAVFGCGGVGLNILEGAKSLNANKIIAVDISDHKLEFAYKFGATHVVNAKNEDPVEKIREITDGGVDYSFDSFGSPMIMKQAVESLGRRGTASLVGLAHPKSDVDLNMVDLVRNEKKVVGSFYGYASPLVTMKKIVDMYLTGKINIEPLIRKKFMLSEINEAFEDIDKGEDGRGVIVF